MGKPYDDVVVILAPAAATAREVLAIDKGEDASATCWYDAFIYTNLPADQLTPADRSRSAQSESIGRLPLVGQEHVLVHWASYRHYIFRFFLGETAARAFLLKLRRPTGGETKELFELKGLFLRSIFEGRETRSRPIRVWWHSELPDLVALPWELMAYSYSSDVGTAAAGVGSATTTASEPRSLFSFTRGLPVETATPKVPISGPLRLAFIHEPRTTSKALLAALDTAPQGVEITTMTGPPREALQQAAAEGYELVHLVTDGNVSLANDGTLYLRKSLKVREGEGAYKNRILRTLLPIVYYLSPLGSLTKWLTNFLEAELEIDKCSPSELSGILRGSRISLLSLSAPKTTNTESDRLDGYLLPRVYRAFCSLGTSRLPLPTMVAPVGATDDDEIKNFWRSFYADLGQHLDIWSAIASGFASQPPMAMALFLRHSDGEVFTRISSEEKERIVDPTDINLALQLSQELVQQLNAQFGEGQDLPENFERLLSKETQRQVELKAQLERWIEPEGWV